MKLIGYINGIEIKFNFYPPDKWEAIIPKEFSGKYILQLKAIDDAGNEAGFTSIIVCVDFTKMAFEVIDKQFKTKDSSSNYVYNELDGHYRFKELVMK